MFDLRAELDLKKACFIVAEISCNHLQKFDLAVELIKEVAKTGADAVKFQTYTPDTITLDCDKKLFQIRSGTVWDGKKLYDLYKEAYTPWDWFPALKKTAEEEGLIFFSTPFDVTSVDFLEKLGVPCYKIASFEITDIPFIQYVARKQKPLIISTGVATRGEMEAALQVCRDAGNEKILLTKCTSSYPTPFEEVNLRAIPAMEREFQVAVGLSDHTRGYSIAVAAVAIGAKLIEKHFILDRNMGGPDAAFSMEPAEFKAMVTALREVEAALGDGSLEVSARAKKNRFFTRSLFAVKEIRKGDIFSQDNVRSIRPGKGLPPVHLPALLGKKATRDIERGTPLSWELVQ